MASRSNWDTRVCSRRADEIIGSKEFAERPADRDALPHDALAHDAQAGMTTFLDKRAPVWRGE